MAIADIRTTLEQLQLGAISLEEAVIRCSPVADLGFAQVDLQRKIRCGFPEVIFCEGKTAPWVVGVAQRINQAKQDCFGTRVSDAQADVIRVQLPNAIQDRLARTFWIPAEEQRPEPFGEVLVLTAGTADLPVAQEALVTAQVMGANPKLIADVGVAGLHRLLRHIDDIQKADVIIVVAGMDGALPSVVGGLADCPVIAVPTSIGYGAAFHGIAPLLTMLNACSAGVTVVNIDAGFKAGYTAAIICKQLRLKQS